MCFFQKRKERPKVISKFITDAIPSAGSEGKAAFFYFPVDKEATTDNCMGWAFTGSWMGRATPQTKREGCPAKPWHDAAPVGLKGTASKQKGLFLSFKI